MRILIVEDEIRLAEALGQIMSEHKYTADMVYNGEDGLDYAMSGIYDVVILDVMLPKMNGFDVVRAMRKEKNQTPVLMLTARFETSDKVKGLDCGADDYLTKPFETEELLARVRALSRRKGEVVVEYLSYGDISLNLDTYMLECGEKSVHLGMKEFEVLRLLLSNPKSVLPKETILLKIWGSETDAEDNNVEVYISFLRKKFAFLGSRASIGTVRKIGYRMEERMP
ncbi:response regulator transcription factor [Qiania dongpingensis]|uniref:Stage 0 sporulation protein A homolog n=1 Tax=Qiania dongpingensis TaxID=2763669 RepID=A0A7G9G436_9FIRM|nr:response regulator transcription factor [Qiania dongpingensis]QNM05568.1 response regulator transcription factor [Qiania dongpingensis]